MKKKISEGNVYRCEWRKSGARFLLSCKELRVQVSACSFCVAEERLVECIMEVTGDCEPCLEFDVPYRDGANSRGGGDRQYFQVGWNGTVEWMLDGVDEAALYSKGKCSGCGIGLGRRTRVARVLTTLPRFDISGLYKDKALAQVWSEGACRYISDSGASCIDLLEVQLAPDLRGKTKKRYYEIIVNSVVECVYPRDMQVLSGWKCPACRRRWVRYGSKIAGGASCCLSEFVKLPSVGAVKVGPWSRLIIDGLLRGAMLKDRGLRGLVTDPIAFLRRGEQQSCEKVEAILLKDIEV